MLTAAAHPERIRALALVEAGPGSGDPSAPEEIGEWLDSWPVPFASREAAVRSLGGGPVGEGWAAGLEERDGGWWPRFDRAVMVRSLEESVRRPFRGEWEQVVCPTLVVLAQSGLVPPREVDDVFHLGPVTVAVSLPGTGHDPHLEQPEVLHTLLSGFLDGLV